MTAVVPDVDLTLDVFYQELEKEILDVPCEAPDPEVHADEFVPAVMLWRCHCRDLAFCQDCHNALVEDVPGGTGIVVVCAFCNAPYAVSSNVIHPLGPLK